MDFVKINPFLNVGAGNKATTQFEPEGPASLFAIILQLGDDDDGDEFVVSDGDVDLTIKHSGKVLCPNVTGERLTAMNAYDGYTDDDNYFAFFFGDPTAQTARGRHLGNFDFTHWPGRMTIEAVIDATATAPVLDAWAVLMPPKSQMGLEYTLAEQQLHRAFVETIIQTSAAVNEKAFDVGLGSEAGALVRKLFNFHTYLTQISVKRSGFDIYEQVPNALARWWQQDIFTRVPQAGLEVWDAIVDGNQSESKGTVDREGKPYNYQYRLSTSDADTITVLADLYTNLRRL